MLDLFGLVTVHHAKPETGKGWRIARVDRTPFGDALLALVTHYFTSTYYYRRRFDDENKSVSGLLQPMLQPFFPEWPIPLNLGHVGHGMDTRYLESLTFSD